MWFFEPLDQVEPLIVIVALVAALATLLNLILGIPERPLLSSVSRVSYSLFNFTCIPAALLGGIFALSYAWFPHQLNLAVASFGFVSLALFLVILIFVLVIPELRFPLLRKALFLPQFKKDRAKDIDDLRKGRSGDITTA